jgi:hypothetical protein
MCEEARERGPPTVPKPPAALAPGADFRAVVIDWDDTRARLRLFKSH